MDERMWSDRDIELPRRGRTSIREAYGPDGAPTLVLLRGPVPGIRKTDKRDAQSQYCSQRLRHRRKDVTCQLLVVPHC